MKKILLILLIICVIVMTYMIVNHDTEVTSDKVLDWLQDYVPEQIAKMYTVETYDVQQNDDGSIDITIHCVKKSKGE